ncbi:DUF6603 domain-containing protein [Mucilaginibacter pedocola]|uniref:DUF6603 domain-containing protein n=1 Tax=Mucilaginibacter pedocola TaxID=1792845 RepID=A0A1S9PG59_9SPHI|nr:DUF6603 domain-containing protein [Mucilaginibacter pedocola]OOQ59960.1 hypothetical protein BC343_27805 [Mucilaginibacter pedocola]
MSTPDLEKIGPEALRLGLLIGLLTGTQASPALNTAWFSDPEKGLNDGFNWPHLKPIVKDFLGKATNPIDAEGDIFNENWFPITIEDDAGKTKNSGFYLVQKTVEKLALLGLGMHRNFGFRQGKATIDPFVFAPIFQMPAEAGQKPLFAPHQDGPIEIGFKLKYDGPLSSVLPYKQLLFWVSFDLKQDKVSVEYRLLDGTGLAATDLPYTPKEIIDIILGIGDVKDFLKQKMLPGDETITITWATLFETLGWVVEEDGNYKAGTILMPGEVGTKVLHYITKTINTAFDEFMAADHELALIEHEAEEEGEPSWKVSLVKHGGRYGVNVQVADVQVLSSPVVKLQIGSFTAEDVDWIANAGGPETGTMGINFYLLNTDEEANSISFDPQFEAISVGVDISGTDEEPLFDIKGYSLQGAKLRGYFSSLTKEDDGGNVYNNWGVAAALDSVSLPLGPDSNGEGVPQTLLASGEEPEEETTEGDKKPGVNPEFSLLVAYVADLYLQLYDENGEEQEIVSIPLDRSFGPLLVNDMGIGWRRDGKLLLFQLSGGLNLSALKLNLDKLTVGVPATNPGDISDFSFGLDGFDLTFNSGPVSMAGGFLKEDADDDKPAIYNGAVAIQAAKWGITALGSFGVVEGDPSLFIFGVLNAALGGPPVFFVTALAAGFGYNRKIVMPAIGDVQNFPFVKAAVQPELFAGKDNDAVLKSMSKVIPPELGQYWFAAGVKFTSFELLNSFALLALQFGKKFEVDVLGLSALQLPKTYANSKLKPYVNAQMALKATFEPEEGLLAVQAQLTNNSYVIDPKCKITGGFAYYSWLKGEHEGDFVVSLGGYNKNFDLTQHRHYPTVPRLAFEWKVSPQVNFSGEAYFALTPSCVMAGGKLALIYQEGDLKAWFKAVADFLIAWKPFHYDIGIAISVGVEYKVNLAFISKTITLELGVDVQLWGPEFGGQAEVRLWIISFTVGFGANNQPAETQVGWQQFVEYFLTGEQGKLLQEPNADPLPGKTRTILTINTNAGLKEKITKDGKEIWVVDPGTFAFNATSVFGVSKISFANGPGGEGDAPEPRFGAEFGARPMGNIIFLGNSSNFTLGLKRQNGDKFEPYSLKDWQIATNKQNVPDALYGTVNDGKEKPAAKLIGGITKGLGSVAPPAPVQKPGPTKFDAEKLAYAKIPKPEYSLDASAKATQVTLQWDGSLDKIKTSISGTAKTTRDDIFTALEQLGSLVNENSDMAVMAAQPDEIFQGSPMLADANAQAKPLEVPARALTAARTSLRRDAVLAKGHQLKATIIRYRFDDEGSGGVVLRGGVYSTAESKELYNASFKTFNLGAGMLQVWDLDAAAGEGLLRHAGRSPLRMVLFDKNLRVVADKVLPASTSGTEKIPASASLMCLQALVLADEYIAGWHEDAGLALLNAKYLLGKACLVRPKRPHTIGFKQFKQDVGLVNGRAVVMNNFSKRDDEPEGWIETRFWPGIKQVFVLSHAAADGSLGAPDADNVVKLIYTDEEGNKAAQLLLPEMSGINSGELWAAYTVPQVTKGSHFSIWVEARSASGLELAGVAGSQTPLEGWTAELSTQLKTNTAGLSPSSAKLTSSISISHPLNF